MYTKINVLKKNFFFFLIKFKPKHHYIKNIDLIFDYLCNNNPLMCRQASLSRYLLIKF